MLECLGFSRDDRMSNRLLLLDLMNYGVEIMVWIVIIIDSNNNMVWIMNYGVNSMNESKIFIS